MLLARLAKTEAFAQTRRDRKKVEMLFAHLKRILRLGRLRGRSALQLALFEVSFVDCFVFDNSARLKRFHVARQSDKFELGELSL